MITIVDLVEWLNITAIYMAAGYDSSGGNELFVMNGNSWQMLVDLNHQGQTSIFQSIQIQAT